MEDLVITLHVEVWFGLFWDCSDGSFRALMGMDITHGDPWLLNEPKIIQIGPEMKEI